MRGQPILSLADVGEHVTPSLCSLLGGGTGILLVPGSSGVAGTAQRPPPPSSSHLLLEGGLLPLRPSLGGSLLMGPKTKQGKLPKHLLAFSSFPCTQLRARCWEQTPALKDLPLGTGDGAAHSDEGAEQGGRASTGSRGSPGRVRTRSSVRCLQRCPPCQPGH